MLLERFFKKSDSEHDNDSSETSKSTESLQTVTESESEKMPITGVILGTMVSAFNNDEESYNGTSGYTTSPDAPERYSDTDSPIMFPDNAKEQEMNEAMKLVHHAMNLILDNKFDEAEAILIKHYETDMHFALGYGAIITFQSLMTFDKKEVEKGFEILTKGLELTESKRQSKADYLRLRAPSYEEVLADLLYAETLLLTSLLTFTQSDSVIALLKGALKTRTSYTIYKSLYHKYVGRAKKGENINPDFLSGIYLGYGSFQIALAMVPPKLMKLMELMGLSGSTERGLKALSDGIELNALRSPLCTMGLLAYHTAFKFNLDPYNVDIVLVESLVTKYLAEHPNCVAFHFFKGRAAALRRDLEAADKIYSYCLTVQDEWKSMYHTCWWELMWTAALRLRWDEAASHAENLFIQSGWSKTGYLYLLAVFRYAQFVDGSPTQKHRDNPNITKLFEDVKEYQIRIAGKRLQVEKYSVRKARTYKRQKNYLFLPAIEALFVWGMFSVLSKEIAEVLIVLCTEREKEDTNMVTETEGDNRALAFVMIGSLWKHLYILAKKEGSSDELAMKNSEENFHKSLSFEKSIKEDHFIIAWCNLELSELFWLQSDYNRALYHLRLCKKVSSRVKYSLEGRIMFKMHNLRDRINKIKPKDDNTV